ncbi:MAG TPA: sulfotransferase [Longimicrobium sp.]|nr:sulfotransferase [Longimicrobium sp.]
METDAGTVPNLFVAGAMKAGTTTLYRYLAGHPDVFMSPVKEPHHFCGDLEIGRLAPGYRAASAGLDAYLDGPMDQARHMAHVPERARYLRLFRDAGARRWRGEASPSYLLSEGAPREVRAASPDARVVIVLRDPVDRAASHYRMDLGAGVVRTGFDQAVREDRRAAGMGYPTDSLYLAMGMYARQVRRWMEAFPPGRVRVYLFDDLRAHPGALMVDLAAFLDVDPAGFRGAAEHENRAVAPRWVALNWVLHRAGAKTVLSRLVPAPLLTAGKRLWYREPDGAAVPAHAGAELRALFASDVAELSALIGRDLSHWTSGRGARPAPPVSQAAGA